MGGSTTRPITVTGGSVDAVVIGVGNTEAGGVGHADTEEADTETTPQRVSGSAQGSLSRNSVAEIGGSGTDGGRR